MVRKELLEAFETARYQVSEPAFQIHIGQRNLEVDQLLENHRRTTWAFITPFNPGSKIIPVDKNEARFLALKKDVNGFFVYEGWGGGQHWKWPFEKSLLILGIGIDRAKDLGRHYGQDAILYGLLKQNAEVRLLR